MKKKPQNRGPVLVVHGIEDVPWLQRRDGPPELPPVNGHARVKNVAVLVERLVQAHGRGNLQHDVNLNDVLAASPVVTYEDEARRERVYTAGRVKYFMDRFKVEEVVDPILVEGQGHLRGIESLKVFQGNHRLRAAVYLQLRTITAEFRGHPVLLQWLTGEVDDAGVDAGW